MTPNTNFILPSFQSSNCNYALIRMAHNCNTKPEYITLNRKGLLRNKLPPNTPVHILGRSKRLLPSIAGLIWILNQKQPDFLVCADPALNRALDLARPFLPKATQFLLWDEQSIPIRMPIAVSDIRDDAKIIQTLHQGRKKTLQLSCIATKDNWGTLSPLLEKLSGSKADKNWTLHILTEPKTASLVQPLIQRYNLDNQAFLLDTLEENEKETHRIIGASDYFLWEHEGEMLSYQPLESLALGTPILILGEKSKQLKDLQSSAPLGAVQNFLTIEDMIVSMRSFKPHPSATYRPSLLPKDYHAENVAKEFEKILRDMQKERTAVSSTSRAA